jgi:hypothetical protein
MVGGVGVEPTIHGLGYILAVVNLKSPFVIFVKMEVEDYPFKE